MNGYLHAGYAASLSQYGTPRQLPRSKGWILQRTIEGAAVCDAMGCYPIFACQDWSMLKADVEDIGDLFVCLSLVTDPLGDYNEGYLSECFPGLVVPFKEHFVVDLSCAPETFINPHHRRNARRASRDLRVEKCDNPEDFLDDWTGLYATLIDRHNIRGITAFSREAFAKQLSVPGIVVVRAIHNELTVGMLLWYAQDNRAYYHLGAYSAEGYELRASFALFDWSIRYFAEQEIKWLNLGAGAGVGPVAKSGLDRFKQGWSTGTRTAYFCGRIFDNTKYQEIIKARGVGPTSYFPAYRVGEFS